MERCEYLINTNFVNNSSKWINVILLEPEQVTGIILVQ